MCALPHRKKKYFFSPSLNLVFYFLSLSLFLSFSLLLSLPNLLSFSLPFIISHNKLSGIFLSEITLFSPCTHKQSKNVFFLLLPHNHEIFSLPNTVSIPFYFLYSNGILCTVKVTNIEYWTLIEDPEIIKEIVSDDFKFTNLT